TVFLTADHAGAHIPEFLGKHKIPGGRWDDGEIKTDLNAFLKAKYKQDNIVSSVMEYDVYLNHPLIDSLREL
ncbi:hypothetical protein ACSLVQ_30905, partial [Klebsiella pneumoniae]|uniref:hypothetical protein n=1 Tax=Klebsiella pneumoniae TaxID=573 RepID=UPI003EE24C92